MRAGGLPLAVRRAGPTNTPPSSGRVNVRVRVRITLAIPAAIPAVLEPARRDWSRMKRTLCAALSLTVVFLLAPAWARESAAVETVQVYKADGTRHCEESQGTSLDAMAQELLRNDIAVYSRRKAHDGREGIAVCGKPTGSLNVYGIAASDVPRALELGFQRLDPSRLVGP